MPCPDSGMTKLLNGLDIALLNGKDTAMPFPTKINGLSYESIAQWHKKPPRSREIGNVFFLVFDQI